MKQIYICGDSFAVTDTEYGNYTWVEQLANLSNVSITNLASVCASNLLINLQVNEAINNRADYIIVLCTAVTRSEVLFAHTNNVTENLFNRFYNLTSNKVSADITTYTTLNLSTATALSDNQKTLLTRYNKEFFDLDLAIYRDCCIIENTLQKLVDSNIPFIFDQGGFEHKSYSGTKNYFNKFDSFKSKLNIWDYSTVRTHRPYFHITDGEIHKTIAEYYADKINKA